MNHITDFTPSRSSRSGTRQSVGSPRSGERSYGTNPSRWISTGSRAIWVLLFILGSQFATAGEMLVNLGPDADRKMDVEPYAAGIAADKNQTRLGINSTGILGEENFDDQRVTIDFSPGWAGIKMAAFSDDGVTVTIRDVTSSATGSSTEVLSNKTKGQALPNLSQSLVDIPYTFLPHHTYSITIDYLNTLYTGDGDVDGAQLIAYGQEGDGYPNNPGGATNSVEFKNTSRGGDRVVSAKDEADGLPGGTKTLEVKVTPATATATLKIKSNGGGTAVFESTGTDTRTVTGTETITIVGRNVSIAARDVQVEASVNEVVMATWDFTVFRVGLTPHASGTLRDLFDRFEFASNDIGMKLTEIFANDNVKSDRLGHFVREYPPSLNATAYGGIIIEGKVVPSGVLNGDFNNTHSRSSSFNWKRVIDTAQFDKNGKLIIPLSGTIIDLPVRDFPDDADDVDEDLTPDRDGTANELLIWSLDFPNIVPKEVTSQGGIVRYRFNALEWANYAGVQASSPLKWTWRASIENPLDDGTREFVQNNDIPNDNVLMVEQWSELTSNLHPIGNNPMTVTGFSPMEFTRAVPYLGPELPSFLVTGTGFPVSPKPTALLFSYSEGDTTTTSSFLRVLVQGVLPTQITAKLLDGEDSVPGHYSAQVFSGPHWSVAPGFFLFKK